MHRVLAVQLVDDHGVSRLVIGGEALGLGGDHPAFLLRAGDHLHHGLVEVGHGDEALVGPGGQQGGLVEQVLQVCPGEARGGLGQVGQGGVLRQRLFPGVDLQDLLPALQVRQLHRHPAVKTTGTGQCRIQRLRTVGSRQNDDAGVALEAVHLR